MAGAALVAGGLVGAAVLLFVIAFLAAELDVLLLECRTSSSMSSSRANYRNL